MRKSYFHPSRHNNQQANHFQDNKHIGNDQLESTNNLREKIRNHPASSSSSSQAAAAEKKETLHNMKRLERMPTEEDINASADAFIKNFRQHLLLQRLESIENHEQMLARGL